MHAPATAELIDTPARPIPPESFAEWEFTGDVRDSVSASSTCAQCGENVRVTLSVRHTATSAQLDVCLSCMYRHPIGVGHAQESHPPRDRKMVLHEHVQRAMHRTCKDIISLVMERHPGPEMEAVHLYYCRNYELSPACAAALFERAAEAGIVIAPHLFSIQTRSDRHRAEFGDLSDGARQRLWPALTPTQQKRLASLGFAPASVRVSMRRSTRRIVEAAPAGAASVRVTPRLPAFGR